MFVDFAASARIGRVLPHLLQELWEARQEGLCRIELSWPSCSAFNCTNNKTMDDEIFRMDVMPDVILQEVNVARSLERSPKARIVYDDIWNQTSQKSLVPDKEG